MTPQLVASHIRPDSVGAMDRGRPYGAGRKLSRRRTDTRTGREGCAAWDYGDGGKHYGLPSATANSGIGGFVVGAISISTRLGVLHRGEVSRHGILAAAVQGPTRKLYSSSTFLPCRRYLQLVPLHKPRSGVTGKGSLGEAIAHDAGAAAAAHNAAPL